jgi:hypothetical protein
VYKQPQAQQKQQLTAEQLQPPRQQKLIDFVVTPAT